MEILPPNKPLAKAFVKRGFVEKISSDQPAPLWPVLYDPPRFVAFYRRYWEIVRKEYKKPRNIAVRYIGAEAYAVTRLLRHWEVMTPDLFDKQRPLLAQAFPKAWAQVGAYLCATMGRAPEPSLWTSAEKPPVIAFDDSSPRPVNKAWQGWSQPLDPQSLGAHFFEALYGISSPNDVAVALHVTPLALSYLFHGQWVPKPQTLIRKGWEATLPGLIPPERWEEHGPLLLDFLQGRWHPSQKNIANPLRHSVRPGKERACASKSALAARS